MTSKNELSPANQQNKSMSHYFHQTQFSERQPLPGKKNRDQSKLSFGSRYQNLNIIDAEEEERLLQMQQQNKQNIMSKTFMSPKLSIPRAEANIRFFEPSRSKSIIAKEKLGFE